MKRIGKILMSGTVYRELTLDEAMIIQKDLAVLRTNDDMLNDRIEFIALSPLFDEIPDQQIIPSYNVICHVEEGQLARVEFVRDPE